MSLGAKIRHLRKTRNWSQQELAAKIGNSDPRQISRYETNVTVPSLEMLSKICEAFEISLDYFSKEKKEQTEEKKSNPSVYLEKIENLEERDRQVLFYLIDSLSKKNKIKELLDQNE